MIYSAFRGGWHPPHSTHIPGLKPNYRLSDRSSRSGRTQPMRRIVYDNAKHIAFGMFEQDDAVHVVKNETRPTVVRKCINTKRPSYQRPVEIKQNRSGAPQLIKTSSICLLLVQCFHQVRVLDKHAHDILEKITWIALNITGEEFAR